jgi:hypothetical protein
MAPMVAKRSRQSEHVVHGVTAPFSVKVLFDSDLRSLSMFLSLIYLTGRKIQSTAACVSNALNSLRNTVCRLSKEVGELFTGFLVN